MLFSDTKAMLSAFTKSLKETGTQQLRIRAKAVWDRTKLAKRLVKDIEEIFPTALRPVTLDAIGQIPERTFTMKPARGAVEEVFGNKRYQAVGKAQKMLGEVEQAAAQMSGHPDFIYHGTNQTAADSIRANGFDPSKLGHGSGMAFGPGWYFTKGAPDPHYNGVGRSTLSARSPLKNPFLLDSDEKTRWFESSIDSLAKELDGAPGVRAGDHYRAAHRKFQEGLTQRGYDGLHVTHWNGEQFPHPFEIVFDPSKVVLEDDAAAKLSKAAADRGRDYNRLRAQAERPKTLDQWLKERNN